MCSWSTLLWPIHFNTYRYYTYVIIDYILALDKYAGT